jgi:6-pyruvoyltetrahydropterin/6-carboxytetrahydropterin synthase
MVLDFGILKKETEAVLESLDHTYLNDLEHFNDTEPSSEHIARYVYEALKARLQCFNLTPYKVTAWESESAGASYQEDV